MNPLVRSPSPRDASLSTHYYGGHPLKKKRVLCLIDNGYDRVWDTSPSVTKEMIKSKSAFKRQDFVTKVISEMVETGAAPAVYIGGIPKVVSPLGVGISQTSFGQVASYR
jgi:hypothetical protein